MSTGEDLNLPADNNLQTPENLNEGISRMPRYDREALQARLFLPVMPDRRPTFSVPIRDRSAEALAHVRHFVAETGGFMIGG